MKTKFILILFATLLSFSCQKNHDTAKPVITLTEVGHENSKQAMQGDDLHLEADILAEGLIKRIDVEIHKEGGDFEIEKSYTEGKYIGVKNIEFHEHIDVPATAPLGAYHLHFTVTDKNGQTTTVEEHIEVIEYNEHDHEED